jgi:hypothetical integral membrane protein (TIGR02206 family)
MQVVTAAERFSAFGTSHQVALVVLLTGALVLVWVGRANRGTQTAVLVAKLLAAAILTLTVPLQILYFTPEYWSLERTLPLQLCDLAWMVAVLGLWTHRWWAVALTYYWGLTLTTQAIITPDLVAEFPDPVFILFWAMHSMVVWAAVYLTWGLGLIPDWRSYRAALVATAAWGVTVFVINVLVGTNYGYLNAKPASASILDVLGDWPWYVLAEVAIIALGWALVTWPWVAVDARRLPRGPTPLVGDQRRLDKPGNGVDLG